MVKYSYVFCLPQGDNSTDFIVFVKCLETSPLLLIQQGVPNGEVVDGVVYTKHQESMAHAFIYNY